MSAVHALSVDGRHPMRTLLAGKYELLAVLGRGGMSDVHLAMARGPAAFRKLVVVKELRPELSQDPDHVAMFLSEARLGARMAHPCVVQVFEVGADAGRLFIAMEHLDGQPLHRLLMKLGELGGLPRQAYLHVLVEMLSGLHYAHELRDFDGTPLKVVHRDVSPHNVFVTYSGHVKLMDFGIAKGLDSVIDTRAGVVKGKASYMAAEHAAAEPVDRRADVYSAGVMLWEALTGSRLFGGMHDVAVLGRIMAGDVPAPSSVRDDVPEELEAICMRALCRYKDGRHPTADALRVDLLGAIGKLGLGTTPDEVGKLVSEAFAAERSSSLRLPASFERATVRDEDLAAMRFDASLAATPLEFGTSTKTDAAAAVTSQSAAGELPTVPPPAVVRRRRFRTAIALGCAGAACLAFAWATGGFRPGKAPAAAAASDRAPRGLAAPGPCGAGRKPLVELSGEIEKDAVLTCDKEYLLKFNVFVRPGVTLTIEKGTTILGDADTRSALVVQPHARLVAEGTPELPIVFTSERPPGQRRAGDWGGVILLGEAPTNLKDEHGAPRRGRVEGLTSGGEYGGTNEDDDSGVLRYVRIEYAGTELAPGNEINGLTLAGVGRKTLIDGVEVREATDDCFEFFGGTVDAKHLVCQHAGDDGFDWDLGYRGRLQFLVFRQAPHAAGGSNGIEGDNDANGSRNGPQSGPLVFNVTLCGRGAESVGEQYGVLARNRTTGRVANAVVTGFDAGVDVRDEGTSLDVVGSVLSGNSAHAIAYPESAGASGPYEDDDTGIDEVNLLSERGRGNSVDDPGLSDCYAPERPRLFAAHPRAEAVSPPNDGFFDPDAKFVGAVRDEDDGWANASWIVWTQN